MAFEGRRLKKAKRTRVEGQRKLKEHVDVSQCEKIEGNNIIFVF